MAKTDRTVTFSPPVTLITTGWYHRRNDGYYTWRPRGIENWLLIYTVSGKGRFGFDGGEVVTQAGDVILIAPGTLHDYGLVEPSGNWELLWAHFHPRAHWLDWLNWPEESPGLRCLSISDPTQRRQMARQLALVHKRDSEAAPRRKEHAMLAFEEFLLQCDAINPRSRECRVDDRIQAALDYCFTHLEDNITLGDLSEASGLSASHFGMLFKRQLGITPQQYLENERLVRAKQLLEVTGLSIKEIAKEIGFQSPFYFSLRFKKFAGMSPRRWRASAKS